MSRPHNPISKLRTVGAFANGRACSDTLFHMIAEGYGRPMIPEERAVMAAGLAGGIGLGGGACGALGAAIWLEGIATLETGASKLDWKSPRILGILTRFQQATEYEFECATIVGRRFDGLADHAAHLAGGGCAELLAALAAA